MRVTCEPAARDMRPGSGSADADVRWRKRRKRRRRWTAAAIACLVAVIIAGLALVPQAGGEVLEAKKGKTGVR